MRKEKIHSIHEAKDHATHRKYANHALDQAEAGYYKLIPVVETVVKPGTVFIGFIREETNHEEIAHEASV